MFRRNNTHNISAAVDVVENHPQNDPNTEEGTKDPFLKYKIFKQISLVIIWICLGFFLEIVGPSLPDLRDRVGVNIEEMSRAMIAISIGVLGGALLGGVLHERFVRHSELIMAIALLAASIATNCIPWIGVLPGVAAMFFVNGFSEGLINTGGNTMVMHMWGEQAAPPMHSLHFGFGLGAIIAPQVVRPFLKPRQQNTTERASLLSSAELFSSNVTSQPPVESRIEYAYLIAGLITFCVAALWLFIYVKGPPEGFPRRVGSKLSRDMFSPGSCARGDVLMGSLIFITLFFYFIQCTGGQRAYGRFLFTFLVESSLKFTNSEAANLNSLFWGSFTVGRATGIPLSRFLKPSPMIAIQCAFLLASSVIVAVWVFDSKYVIWVCSVPIGYFMAQVFPSGMSWSNIYLDMNSVGVMVFLIGTSAGGVIYQYLPGYLLNRYGQESLMYVMVAYSAGLLLAFVIMLVLARVHMRRNPDPDSRAVDDDVVEVYAVQNVKLQKVTNVEVAKV